MFDVAFGVRICARRPAGHRTDPACPSIAHSRCAPRSCGPMQDAELLAETSKLGLEARPSSGQESRGGCVASALASFPKSVIERATAGMHERSGSHITGVDGRPAKARLH